VAANVADDASPPRNARRPIVAVSPEAVTQILEAARSWFAVLFRVAAVTGARRGEMVGLQWRDVDFVGATITVRRSVVRSKESVRVVRDTTKTNRHGTVSVDVQTIKVLRTWRASCGKNAIACGVTITDDAFLFSPQPDGSIPRWPKDVDYEFVRTRDACGLSGFSFKDATRHFVATQLIARGEDVRTVAGRLRHATPSQTLNTYAHFLPERDRQAGHVIGSLLDGQA
jgi:integrase